MSHTLPSPIPAKVLLSSVFNCVYPVLRFRYFVSSVTSCHSSVRPSFEDKLTSLSRQSAASSFVRISLWFHLSLIAMETRPPPSSVLRPPSPQSTCTPSPVFPASLHHVLLIISWFLAPSDELGASPEFIFLSLDLSLPPLLSVAASLRSSILIPSTPPPVHPSHVKSLSREDVPRVSAHPSASLWNCIHFICYGNKFATSTALPVPRGWGGATLIFSLSFRRGCLEAATATRPAHARAGSHTNTLAQLHVCGCFFATFLAKRLSICLCSPGRLLFALCHWLLTSTAVFTHLPTPHPASPPPISSQQFLTRLNISCHSESSKHWRLSLCGDAAHG